ncbi:MAG TPA: DUF72 domain-containing protein [Actinomycetota bacterium]|nr:DUF72 domain-containing protein [Actinomycetota bacterium]
MRELVLVGCCGFPVRRDAYVAEFPVVEVQQTFYQLPSVSTARRWRDQAPPGFVHTMKAWQLITHSPASPTYRRLREPLRGSPDAYGSFRPTPEVQEAWRRTLEVALALEARVVVFQCPASFRPTERHVADLRGFFERAPRDGLALAWEPRGGWPPELVRELCVELDLVHCVDPFSGREVHGGFAYWRLHGVGGYRYRYTDDDLRALLGRCREALEAGRAPVYVLFNNLAMLEDARRFRALLREAGTL